MPSLPEEILSFIADSPGLTDREITDELRGPAEPQQPVNQAARRLESKGRLIRRERPEDGLIGNYPADGSGGLDSAQLQNKVLLSNEDALPEDGIKDALGDHLQVDDTDESPEYESLRYLRERAVRGDVTSQVMLGEEYYYGRELGYDAAQDYAKAAKWYRMAAEQGDSRAQVKLGTMYALGEGVPQDRANAEKLYREAIEHGDADTCKVALDNLIYTQALTEKADAALDKAKIAQAKAKVAWAKAETLQEKVEFALAKAKSYGRALTARERETEARYEVAKVQAEVAQKRADDLLRKANSI